MYKRHPGNTDVSHYDSHAVHSCGGHKDSRRHGQPTGV